MKELIISLQKKLGVTADGIIGKQTLAAIAKFIGADVTEVSTDTVKNIQRILGVTADGVIGPKTLNAIINGKTTVIAGAENLLIQKIYR
jgi:lysozyme family protein